MSEENKQDKAKEQARSLFREKSLETISSPEEMDHYLRVTSPGVWALLAGVIIVLAGIVVWGIFGHIDSKVQVAVVSGDDGTYCYVPKDDLQAVAANPVVVVDGQSLEMEPATLEPMVVKESTNVYILLAGNLNVGDVVYPIKVTTPVDEGVYSGNVTTERISPISLLLN